MSCCVQTLYLIASFFFRLDCFKLLAFRCHKRSTSARKLSYNQSTVSVLFVKRSCSFKRRSVCSEIAEQVILKPYSFVYSFSEIGWVRRIFRVFKINTKQDHLRLSLLVFISFINDHCLFGNIGKPNCVFSRKLK